MAVLGALLGVIVLPGQLHRPARPGLVLAVAVAGGHGEQREPSRAGRAGGEGEGRGVQAPGQFAADPVVAADMGAYGGGDGLAERPRPFGQREFRGRRFPPAVLRGAGDGGRTRCCDGQGQAVPGAGLVHPAPHDAAAQGVRQEVEHAQGERAVVQGRVDQPREDGGAVGGDGSGLRMPGVVDPAQAGGGASDPGLPGEPGDDVVEAGPPGEAALQTGAVAGALQQAGEHGLGDPVGADEDEGVVAPAEVAHLAEGRAGDDPGPAGRMEDGQPVAPRRGRPGRLLGGGPPGRLPHGKPPGHRRTRRAVRQNDEVVTQMAGHVHLPEVLRRRTGIRGPDQMMRRTQYSLYEP